MICVGRGKGSSGTLSSCPAIKAGDSSRNQSLAVWNYLCDSTESFTGSNEQEKATQSAVLLLLLLSLLLWRDEACERGVNADRCMHCSDKPLSVFAGVLVRSWRQPVIYMKP
jgi:hypothetical protein